MHDAGWFVDVLYFAVAIFGVVLAGALYVGYRFVKRWRDLSQ